MGISSPKKYSSRKAECNLDMLTMQQNAPSLLKIFKVEVCRIRTELWMSFVAPKGTQIRGTVTGVGDGSYNVEYTPSKIGIHRNMQTYFIIS